MTDHYEGNNWDEESFQEHQRQQLEAQQQRELYKEWINNRMEDMDVNELRMLYDVAYNSTDYYTFFKVIKRLNN